MSGRTYNSPPVSDEKFEELLNRVNTAEFSQSRGYAYWDVDVDEDQFAELLKEHWASPHGCVADNNTVLWVRNRGKFRDHTIPGRRLITFWRNGVNGKMTRSGFAEKGEM